MPSKSPRQSGVLDNTGTNPGAEKVILAIILSINTDFNLDYIKNVNLYTSQSDCDA